MRKTAIYLFLILANIILLAHHAIPHHHHHAQVCMVKSHCHTHEHNDDADSNLPGGHNHDDDQQTTDCVLKQNIIRPSNNWKQHIILPEYPTGQSHNPYFLMTDHELRELSMPEPKAYVDHKNSLSYYQYFSSTSGLRAPPKS